MLVSIRIHHKGCAVAAEVPVDDAVAVRWQKRADAHGRSIAECVSEVCDDLDDAIRYVQDPHFAMSTDIEFAQDLFCHAATLKWACPWNCDTYEQSVDDFRADLRSWWAYLMASDEERERIVAAGEAALEHDGKAVRRLLGNLIDHLGGSVDSTAAPTP